MGLTKQYLKYSPGATFGVVNGRQSNAILMESSRGTLAGAGHKLKPAKQLWIVAPALENVHVWDPRKEERVCMCVYRHVCVCVCIQACVCLSVCV